MNELVGPPSSRRHKGIFFILIVSLLVLIGVTIFGFLINRWLKEPQAQNNTEKIFTIESGEGIKEIAENLEKEGLIKHSWLFVAYAGYKKLANRIQVGKYGLRPSMTIPEILEILSQGKVKEIVVTFPEGFTLEQIASRLEKRGVVKKDEFEKAAKKYYPFEFLNDRPTGQSLEGFLFPDTYKFSLDITAEAIVEKMLLNFDRKLDYQLRQAIKRTNMNIYEIVTMASIIEKEASNYEDRRIIAGIFYKRWNSGQPLQSCATLAYILKSNKRRFSYQDTQTKSPYNTYLHKGLPPGPICNPGLSSIKAAIYPQKTDYLYFLSTKEGKTIFAKTYEEQLANEKKYLE